MNENTMSTSKSIVDLLCNEIKNTITKDYPNECVRDLHTIVYVVYKYYLGEDVCKYLYCDSVKLIGDALSIDFRIKAYIDQLDVNKIIECDDILCRYIETRNDSEKCCQEIFSLMYENTYKDKKINSFKIVSKPSVHAYIDNQNFYIGLDKSSFDFDIHIKVELKYEHKN